MCEDDTSGVNTNGDDERELEDDGTCEVSCRDVGKMVGALQSELWLDTIGVKPLRCKDAVGAV